MEALEGPIALTECSQGAQSCELSDTCLAKASWDPVSRAIHGALSNLALSSIAPPCPPEAPSPAALVTLGVHAS